MRSENLNNLRSWSWEHPEADSKGEVESEECMIPNTIHKTRRKNIYMIQF
jgi:hypothetical protein